MSSGAASPNLPAESVIQAPSAPRAAVVSLQSKLVVGGIAGVMGTSAVFPLDIVKTRLQSQKPSPVTGELRYRGPLHCFRTILGQEGPRGLYRGLGANLVGVTPEKAIKLAVNDVLREMWTDPVTGGIALRHELAAGALAGTCQVVATNPMEIVKIRLQMQGAEASAVAAGGGTVPVRGPAMSGMQVVRHLGVRGLYRGAGATLMRDVPFSIIFFPLYANLKLRMGAAYIGWRQGVPSSMAVLPDSPPVGVTLLSGMAAGAVAAGTMTPADVVKTRLQEAGGRQRYHGIVDCFGKVYKEGGARALFKGAGPRMAVQAPLFGIALLAFEVQKAIMARWQ